ncbi:hypothetical protein PG988_003831 [Apiospora saccharicola]
MLAWFVRFDLISSQASTRSVPQPSTHFYSMRIWLILQQNYVGIYPFLLHLRQFILDLTGLIIPKLFPVRSHLVESTNLVLLPLPWTKTTPSPSLLKRRSIAEQIEHIELNEHDEYTFQYFDELDEHEIKANGFRWAARGTQRDQDFVYTQYQKYLFFEGTLSDDLSQDERDNVMFPADNQRLFKQLRRFVIFVTKFGRGRRGRKMSYPRITQYRRHLIFWTNRTYERNESRKVAKGTLWNQITEAMQSAAKKYGFVPGGNIFSRAEVGLAELRQLIDHDLATTPCIALAESHQLAWLLMRVCCVRPGSIGWSNQERLELGLYLKWSDIQIFRDSESEFKFTARITFRSLKTNSQDPERAQKKAVDERMLICNVKSPENTDALYFSIPHRLLVMALRRKLLRDVETMEQLVECEFKRIAFKPEALNKPVVCAATPRGLGITHKPAKADALSTYLATRGHNIGYNQRITFLSIRRRAATHFAEKVGVERARRFMNHHARVSITHGDTIGPASNHGQSADLIKGNNHLALGAIIHDPEAFKRVHGPTLNIIAESCVRGALLDGIKDCDMKNLKKRARKSAMRWLLGKESADMAANLSIQQWDERLDSLERSHFWDDVLHKARADMQDASHDDEDDSNDPTVNHATGFFHEGPMIEYPEEPDLEDQSPTDKTDGSYDRDTVQVGDEGFEPEDDQKDVPYDNAAKAFMDHIMGNTFSRYTTFKYNPVQCPSCLEDPTAEPESKNRMWNNKKKLESHMSGEYHTPKSRFFRRIDQLKLETGGDLICPYCKEIGHLPPERWRWPTHTKLARHIKTHSHYTDSNSNDARTRHRQLAEEDGWFNDPNFNQFNDEVSVKKRASTAAYRKKQRAHLARLTLRYSNEIELGAPVQHQSINDLVYGGGLLPLPECTHLVPCDANKKLDMTGYIDMGILVETDIS